MNEPQAPGSPQRPQSPRFPDRLLRGLSGLRDEQIALLDLLRALLVWPTLALLLLGLLAGALVDRLQGGRFEHTVAWSLKPVWCPGDPEPKGARFDQFSLPATAIEGLGVRPPEVPERLAGSLLRCRMEERQERSGLSCRVQASTPQEARRLAVLADQEALRPGSAFSQSLAEARIVGRCGWDYVQARGRLPKGTSAIYTFLPRTPLFSSLRAQLADDVRSAGPGTPAPPESPKRRGPLLGLVAALFASALFAAWRARRPIRPSSAAPAQPGRLAEAALAGLMLTASMDQFLVLDAGPFTLRLGHLCALVLLAVLLFAKHRGGGPGLALPARSVLASLGFLALAALSAIGSGNPAKSIGYLAWGSFDLFVVLAGIAAFADDERRLERALRWWLAGMALAAAVGLAQLGLWGLGIEPPFLYYDAKGFPRIDGFSYEPSYFALYLVPGALVLLTRFALLGRRAWRSGALGLALMLTVALSTSRSGWLGAAFGVGLIGLRAWLRLGKQVLARTGIAVACLALACALILAVWPQMRSTAARFARMAVDRNEVTSSRPRLASLEQATHIWRRNPVLGVGIGGYGAWLRDHPEILQLESKSAHELVTTNLYLELGAETGAVGLAAALAMLLLLLAPLGLAEKKGVEPSEPMATREGLRVAAVTVFLVLFQFSQTLWRLDIWVLLGLCFAAGLARGFNEPPASEPRCEAEAGPPAPGPAATAD